jgi:RimJ/RimL family protein N-acetyltransferase
VELGYWVAAAATRRGVATAGARQLCAEAFSDPAVEFVEIARRLAQ